MSADKRRHPRIHLHDDHQYLSVGFEGEPDALLKLPEGWRDRDRVIEWRIAIGRLIAADAKSRERNEE